MDSTRLSTSSRSRTFGVPRRIAAEIKTQRAERSPERGRTAIVDFGAEAERLALPLGPALSDDEARARLAVLATDAQDIFASPTLGMDYLTTKPLDGQGRTGVQILREKGLPGVLAGLDHLRFGSRG